jgi:Arc/MetJ-type ribon-helix-helix transcriptional regulator
MAQLSVRLPDSLLESLREEARRSGFGNVSDYARRKLAASAPSSRIEQKIDRLAESLSLVSERTARIESRLEETAPSLPSFPSRPMTYSPTWIPPEDEPPDLSE